MLKLPVAAVLHAAHLLQLAEQLRWKSSCLSSYQLPSCSSSYQLQLVAQLPQQLLGHLWLPALGWRTETRHSTLPRQSAGH